jgi:hypothetical protein
LVLSELDVCLRSDGAHLLVYEPSPASAVSNSTSSTASTRSGGDVAVLRVSLSALDATVKLRHAGRRNARLTGPAAFDGAARVAAPTAALADGLAPAFTSAGPTPAATRVAGSALGTTSFGAQARVAASYWHHGLQCWEPLLEPWAVSLAATGQLSALGRLPPGVASAVGLPQRPPPPTDAAAAAASPAEASSPGVAGGGSGGVPSTPRSQAARLTAALAWESPRALSQSLSDTFLAALEKVGVARRPSGGFFSSPPLSPAWGPASLAADAPVAPAFASVASSANESTPGPASDETRALAPLDSPWLLRSAPPEPLGGIEEERDAQRGDGASKEDVEEEEEEEEEEDESGTAAVAVAVTSHSRLEVNVSEALLETAARLAASCATVGAGKRAAALALENDTGARLWFCTGFNPSFSGSDDGGTCITFKA